MPDYWTAIERVSAVVALGSLPYLVRQQRKRKADIGWDFKSSHREVVNQGSLDYGVAHFTGSLKNQSLEDNTVQRVWLVVWRTSKRRATRRLGHGDAAILDGSGAQIGPTLHLPARQSRDVSIRFKFPLTGTADAPMFEATAPTHPGSRIEAARYEYSLGFEDVAGNFFDDHGKLRSLRSLNLRWTLDNAWERLKDGHPMPILKHLSIMWWEDFTFAVRRALRSIGL